jgi:multiple sugar transport system substrate-binding protein
MFPKKPVSKVFVFLVIASLLAACSGAPATSAPASGAATAPAGAPTATTGAASSSAGKVVVTFWNAFTGSDADNLKAIVNDYNQTNKDNVQVQMDIMSGSVFTQKVPPSIATHTAPSLIALNVADTLAYSKQGSIEDLSDFFTATGLDKSSFLPSSLDLGNIGGKQYGIPMQIFDSTNMYWNKDLFKAAGLDPEKPPKTFDELMTDAVKLTDASKNQYGFGMCASAAPQFYAVFIKGNGGDVVDPTTNKSVLNSPQNIQTFNYLHTLAFTDAVTPKSTGGVAMDNLMQSGKIAIYFDGPWLIPGLKSHNINFGVTQVPAGSAGTFAILDGTMFAIPTGTDAAHKTAVYSFLKYWNSTDVAKKWSMGDGMPPYLISAVNDSQIKADPLISTLADNEKIAKQWLPGITAASNIDANVLFPLIEQLQNQGDVTTLVNKASQQVDAALQGQ